MTEYNYGCNTGDLTREENLGELDRILLILAENGIVKLNVSFGYAWAGEYEWLELTLDVEDVSEELKKAEKLELGELGSDDLTLAPPDGSFELKFCHHGDIHLDFLEDGPVVERILEVWKEKGWITGGGS